MGMAIGFLMGLTVGFVALCVLLITAAEDA
jgi:hypothetical protein